MIAAEEVTDVRTPDGQRKRIPHGNMRAKLLNYIGQIFECKADSSHYSRRGIAHWHRNLQRREVIGKNKKDEDL
jgi:hypothetical protein